MSLFVTRRKNKRSDRTSMLMPKQKKRANVAMVDDNDPQFCRFWDAYPKRVAKKEARKAWAEIDPDLATVDRMVATLAWQSKQPAWMKDGYQFAPYPASWLRAERWTDEPPPSMVRTMSDAAAAVFETLGVKL